MQKLLRNSIQLFVFLFAGIQYLPAQDISITYPQPGDQFEPSQTISIGAQVSSVIPGEPLYLHVINNQTGFRKLKLGNNPNSIYNPSINVIGAGNDKMEITLKDLNGTANWSKIRVKPSAIGTLNLSPYIAAAGGGANDWTTISIPLAHFDQSINFSAISNIEFPYSAGAPFFELAISEIKFTGSPVPVLWFGAEKNNNAHNGNGGPGELIASIIEGTEAVSNVEKVVFYANGNEIGEDLDYPFEFVYELPATAGSIIFQSQVLYNDGSSELSAGVIVDVTEPVVADLAINISSPQENLLLEYPVEIIINAEVLGAEPKPNPFIHVTNTLSGFRKLKLGYNSNTVYGNPVNPVASGNDTLEITLADNLGTTNWSKIRIRPSALGSLNLAAYVSAAGGIGQQGNTIKIPLSDFDPAIDFSGIAMFEFPYSADAGTFDIAIYSMKFTGGTTEFVWFGESKTDNLHNGNGGSGELVAETVIPEISGTYITKVDFYQDGVLVYEDAYPPFVFSTLIQTDGMFEFSAIVFGSGGESASSNNMGFVVTEPPVLFSDMNIAITSPSNNQTLLSPARVNIEAAVSGKIEPQPAYLLVTNNQTGFRKLKFGNNSNSIYNPSVNLVQDGNHTLEITMKALNTGVNWSKIRVRPEAIGTLVLAPYVQASGSDMADWTTLSIPLSDFDPSIDFSTITHLEFPYSASAGNFELAIQKVEFTGGNTPYLWFGDDKLNNAHNGNGGSGELVANLVQATNSYLDVAKIEFFIDGDKVGERMESPWFLEYDFNVPGTYQLSALLTDTDGLHAHSQATTILVEELAPDGGVFITLEFNEIPDNVVVSKATLKYNKDFAYSFALDDGRADAYTHAFKLMNGGYMEANQTTYPGLFYTDGCGNDIAFAGALGWNSVSKNGNDLHINTPDYMTWNNLVEMYNAGWDVINHSYSHAHGEGTNYIYEITQNRDYVMDKVGIDMTHFLPPSGDNNYIQHAFDLGYKVVHTRHNSYLGYSDGLPIDNALDYFELRIYRKLLYDDGFNIGNVSRYLDDVAAWSTNGNHYWWSEFTHRVRHQQTGASLVFPTFEYYMNYIEQAYGKSGSDRIWMAPVQEVYEYLRARDESDLSFVQDGKSLSILIDPSNLPTDLRNYLLTLVIEADQAFSEVNISGGEIVSFNGSADKKLINFKWDGTSSFKSGTFSNSIAEESGTDNETPIEQNSLLAYPNPVIGNEFSISLQSNADDIATVAILDIFGKLVWEGKMELFSGTNTITIPCGNLGNGIYIVRVNTIKTGICNMKINISR